MTTDKLSPNWTCPIILGGNVEGALATISQIHRSLLENSPDFAYKNVHVEQLDCFIKMLEETANVREREAVTSKIRLVLVYKRGEPVRLLSTFLHLKQLILAQLLNQSRLEIAEGHMLVPFICFRSIIEHCAHFHDATQTLNQLNQSCKELEFEMFTEQLNTLVKKTLLATRFDWDGLDGLDHEQLAVKLANGSIYKAKADQKFIDLNARSILTLIERLNKSVPLARGAYELLCEFAHPNVGALFAVTTDIYTSIDQEGITWETKQIGSGEMKVFDDLSTVFSNIFVQMSEILMRFEKDSEQFIEQRNVVQSIMQNRIRIELKNPQLIVNGYAECPCASGAKIKFCCGR
ncbi:MAG: hypothetical protein P4L53_06730 [Candidatus Obscuribacterales bacterium]|nr:hypothetical protein [Candidatus Obscuribacterales bacterium]